MFKAKLAPKLVKHNKKILIGLVFLSFTLVFSTGVAFADSDIAAMLTNWFNSKSQAAISSMDHAIQAETSKQEERLKEELRLKMQQSAQELDQYAKEQQAEDVQAVSDYADQLISNYKASSDAGKQNLKVKLDTILTDSKKQMDQAVKDMQNKPAQ